MIRAVQTEAFGNEEACPVPDYFLARLYRSTANEARDLCLPLPDNVRARLALFCSARVHLRELARTIATTCAQSALMREGRESGRVLWEDAMRHSPETHGFRSLRKGVTLAGPSSIPQFLSFEPDELEPDELEPDDSEPGASETDHH